MPAAPRSRHPPGCGAPLLRGGPLAGRDRRRAGHQPSQRLADAHRGAEAGHRRDPDQRPGRPGARAGGRAARPFGLRDVRVAHAGTGAGQRLEDQVGTQAARLLLDNLKDSMTVALSWGHALQSMVYATTADQELPRPHARPARRRPLLDPQRDQRPGAGPRARRTPRAPTTASCTRRPRSSPPRLADALLAEPSIAESLAQAAPGRPGLRRDRHPHATAPPPRSSTRSNLSAGATAGVLGRRPGRRHRGPLLRRPRPARSTAPSRTASSASP